MNIHVGSLATLLGVKSRSAESLSPFDLADEVCRGLPVDSVDRVCDKVAPDDVSFRYRVIPKATLARRRRAPGRRLSREESDRVARQARIWEFAMGVWKSEAAVQRFLAKPHQMLAGRIPREFTIESELGAREVETLLGRVKYGIPT